VFPVIVVAQQEWAVVRLSVTRARGEGPGTVAVAAGVGSSRESSPPSRCCQEAFSSHSP